MLIVIGGWALTTIKLFTGSGMNRFILNQVFSFEKRKKVDIQHLTLLERIQIAMKKRGSARFNIFSVCRRRDKVRLTKANERVEPALDIVTFIRQYMSVNIALRLLFTKRQRYMIQQQRRPFVLTEKADSSESSDFDTNEMLEDMGGPINSKITKKLMFGMVERDRKTKVEEHSETRRQVMI